eukprot:TRINITY_DN11566_c0_g3_i1.p4 TRINITY_DN11566_c0_g3~~TRINITY_DN11566_c0_g3_i1.p4  ORF type:complete len:124 (+),score=44.23 TRINITY_DN11566_c0_g3_i1:36-407(+)
MDIEVRCAELAESKKINMEEYKETTLKIAEKMDHVASLSSSVYEVEHDTNEKLMKFIEFHHNTSQFALSSIVNIKEKLENICKEMVEIHRSLEKMELERMRGDHEARAKALKDDLEEFKSKKR